MTPPPAFAGTVPPSRTTLDADIANIHKRARRKRLTTFAAVAALGVAGWYGREKLGAREANASKEETGAIQATAKKEGIKLVVDGKDIGTLPQEIKGLAPGEHSVVFEGGDRYAPQKATITLSPSETKQLELVSLKVTKGAATFDVKTPGTTLTLVSADERRTLTDYSHPVDIDNSKSWTLEASKSGFRTLTMPINFDDDAEKTFVVALTEPSKPTDTTVAATDTGTDITSSKGGHTTPASTKSEKADKPEKADSAQAKSTSPPAAQAAAAPAAPAAPKAAAGTGGNCTLNINSIPTSKITLDGKAIGMTPKIGVSVPSGAHSVMLVTDSGGRKATSVTCKGGETKTIAQRISQ